MGASALILLCFFLIDNIFESDSKAKSDSNGRAPSAPILLFIPWELATSRTLGPHGPCAELIADGCRPLHQRRLCSPRRCPDTPIGRAFAAPQNVASHALARGATWGQRGPLCSRSVEPMGPGALESFETLFGLGFSRNFPEM